MTPRDHTDKLVIPLEHLRSVPERDRWAYVDFVVELTKRLSGEMHFEENQGILIDSRIDGKPKLDQLFTDDELAAIPWGVEALAVARYDLAPTGVCLECGAYSPNGKYGSVDQFKEYMPLRDEIEAPKREASTTYCPECADKIYSERPGGEKFVDRKKLTTLRGLPARVMGLLLEMPQEQREEFLGLPDDEKDTYLMERMNR